MKHCWICGAPANSREHKIKRSTLRLLYGRGPYKGDKALYHGKDDAIVSVQGPDSARLKYSANICSGCNSTASQEADRAFEHFVQYWLRCRERILGSRVLDLNCFGSGEHHMAEHLFRYFAKHLGCDLEDSGFIAPRDLADLILGKASLTHLRLSFAIDFAPPDLPVPVTKTAGIGPLITTVRNLRTKDEPRYIWSSHIGELRTFYWYGCRPNAYLGHSWDGTPTVLQVGEVTAESNPRDASFIIPA